MIRGLVTLAFLSTLVGWSYVHSEVYSEAAVPSSAKQRHSNHFQYELLDGVELVWQRPRGAERAVILLAHGCSHSATDFFPFDRKKCTKCLGLPEERRIVQAALARGFVAVAISSADRVHSRCWDPQTDGPRVRVACATTWQHAYAKQLRNDARCKPLLSERRGRAVGGWGSGQACATARLGGTSDIRARCFVGRLLRRRSSLLHAARRNQSADHAHRRRTD